ncbi:hypothetical protein Tco_1090697 [Tanacetum coccineum]|uniref:Zinc finger, CCHC-type n=1 Tax=Tanacetum coccineum TaxID=301880 RepID=A0ABQ5I626_9ASTR
MLANKQEGKPVAAYVLKMKGYVEQLERLGYVLPQDLTVGLILNGLTSDFARFVRNYNMHNMEKTVGELHAMLIGYEKGLPKKAETPQVMMIKGDGRITYDTAGLNPPQNLDHFRFPNNCNKLKHNSIYATAMVGLRTIPEDGGNGGDGGGGGGRDNFIEDLGDLQSFRPLQGS